ncbi:integrase [Citrobacter sp. wls619]|uniref:phage integrase Arm DNA-binding domain-containing protein n=1 Tax=Citrobacter sp. wls619 TaxID=2576432 RepID=UPI0010C98A3B|nr:phage integrase Arm DNA-binding domain-containing protein [Citrobacter sp. wls619]TKV08234.1 integrase [Citrobacter sp. wls619]
MAARPRSFNVSIPNLYCKLDKRTNKVYWQYKHPSSGKFIGFGTDADTARTAAVELNRIHAEQQVNQSFAILNIRSEKAGRKSEMLLSAWVERYCEILDKRLGKGDLSVRTATSGKRLARRLAERFPRTPITEVSARELSAILTEYTDQDKNRMAQALRYGWVEVFKEAQYAGVVNPGFNPAEATRNPKVTVSRQRLGMQEWWKIFEAASSSYLKNAMLLAMLTGQRPGDIVKMKFSDIWDDHLHVVQNKTGTQIAIPLSIKMEEIGMNLREVVSKCRDCVVSKYLVHHTKRMGVASAGDGVTARALTDAFSMVRDRVEIVASKGKTPPTFYEQRSLSGRVYKRHGLDVQALWGHKNKEMSEVYLDEREKKWIVIAV